MNRLIKILTGFSCLFLGCMLTMHVEEDTSVVSWLNPPFHVLGFALILVGGLYTFLKLVRPFIY